MGKILIVLILGILVLSCMPQEETKYSDDISIDVEIHKYYEKLENSKNTKEEIEHYKQIIDNLIELRLSYSNRMLVLEDQLKKAKTKELKLKIYQKMQNLAESFSQKY